jgi:hypothetical protein
MNTNNMPKDERSESCLSTAKTASAEEQEVREYLLREFAKDMFPECNGAGDDELERSESESYFERSEKEPASSYFDRLKAECGGCCNCGSEYFCG